MLIVDNPGLLKSGAAFSARAAGVLGFSQFGRDHTYLLTEDMHVAWSAAEAFLEKHRGETVLIFGFTSIVWQSLAQQAANDGRRLDLGDSILIHGGGWKKLVDQQVSNDVFRATLRAHFGIKQIYNYYGMVEQTGSIFMECSEGVFHAPSYADVLVRDPATLDVVPNGAEGLLQLMSNIPHSYPGHILLSEDLGTILGEDDCACGRKGRYFRVHGRLPQAELRGCSDTVQEPAAA
jgi:hypothetical protein